MIGKKRKESFRDVSKKNFEKIKFGIERLKQLEEELNLLNPQNFPVEEASIRSKLKDVSRIPEIEGEMKSLKRKIKHQLNLEKKDEKSSIKKLKELGGDIKNLRESNEEFHKTGRKEKVNPETLRIPEIEKEMRSLKRKISEGFDSKKDEESLAVRKLRELAESIKELKEKTGRKEKVNPETLRIPEIEKEMRSLKRKISEGFDSKKDEESLAVRKLRELAESIKELKEKTGRKEKVNPETLRIPEIEKEMRSLKRKISEGFDSKKDEESLAVRKLRELGGEIKDLKESQEDLLKGKILQKAKVDLGVGTLVDVDFNNFLDELKVSLSEKIKDREKEIDKILNEDLKNRERNFKSKKMTLVNEYDKKKKQMKKELEEKYEKEIRKNLKKEVDERFNKELKQELLKERFGLEKKYKKELNDHVAVEINFQKEKMKRDLESEKKSLEKARKEFEIQRKKKEEQINLEKEREMNLVKKKLAKIFHAKLEASVSKKVGDIKRNLKKEFQEKSSVRIKKHNEELQKKLKQVLS